MDRGCFTCTVILVLACTREDETGTGNLCKCWLEKKWLIFINPIIPRSLDNRFCVQILIVKSVLQIFFWFDNFGLNSFPKTFQEYLCVKANTFGKDSCRFHVYLYNFSTAGVWVTEMTELRKVTGLLKWLGYLSNCKTTFLTKWLHESMKDPLYVESFFHAHCWGWPVIAESTFPIFRCWLLLRICCSWTLVYSWFGRVFSSLSSAEFLCLGSCPMLNNKGHSCAC